MNSSTNNNLRIWNGVMFFFHLVQALTMLFISNDVSFPVNGSFLRFDPATRTLNPLAEELFRVNIGVAVSLFLFMSAFAHLLLTLPGIYQWYRQKLNNESNPARWIEYSLSSSLMIIIIAALCGVYEVGALIAIFVLNALMNLFGLLMERYNPPQRTSTDWLSFNYGVLAGIVPWIIIGIYFWGSVRNFADGIPEFVYAIIASLFICFNIFAINMILQYKKIGPWKNYLFGEKAYIILSLVAKSVLAWQVWSGSLR